MSNIDTLVSAVGLDQDARWDAKATSALDQELEFVRSQTYDVRYPELKARMLIPTDNTVDPGAETVTYHQWDDYGMAEIIANYADDISLVDTLKEKFSQNIESVGKAYQYSVQDLRRAAMANNSLDMRRARACRGAIERRIDEIAAFGDAKTKMKGMLNHPNVTILTATNDGTATEWTAGRATPKTPANILKDMHDAASHIWVTTLETHIPNTIVLSSAEYGYISQQPVGTDNQMTILRSFLANNPYVTAVESWHKLNTADAAGTGPRMVCYQRDPDVLEMVIPQEFEQFPAQARNLAFVVPCHARVGGVVMYYPLAVVYMDGI